MCIKTIRLITIFFQDLKIYPNNDDPKKSHRSYSFRMYFDRGDLPIKMEYLSGGDKIGWTVRED